MARRSSAEAGAPPSSSRKIHGLPRAARPIITASQPVSAIMRRASAGLFTSPLPTTGMRTAAFTLAISRQSAEPE